MLAIKDYLFKRKKKKFSIQNIEINKFHKIEVSTTQHEPLVLSNNFQKENKFNSFQNRQTNLR